MEELLTETESPPKTVTITLDNRALVVGLVVLVAIGAMGLGVWAGRLLSAPKVTPQRAAAPGQVSAQTLRPVQAPVSSLLQQSQSKPAGTAGITVNVGTADPLAGKPAPDFTLENLQGERVSLSDLKGQPVLINFWATWCPPCRFEMPAIESAYRKYKDQGFVVLAVDVQEPRDVVHAYVKKLDLTFPVVLDSDGQVAIEYRIRAYPTSYFVNREGQITQVHRGMMTSQIIESYLADILPEG